MVSLTLAQKKVSYFVVLHESAPFIGFELDELETEFVREDFDTIHPLETD